METEYDDNVLDFLEFAKRNFFKEIKKDNDLHGDNDNKNTLPRHFGAFF